MSQGQFWLKISLGLVLVVNIVALWLVYWSQQQRFSQLESVSQESLVVEVQPSNEIPTDTSSTLPVTPGVEDLSQLQTDLEELKSQQTKQQSLLSQLQTSLESAWAKLTAVEQAATTVSTTSTGTSVGGSNQASQEFSFYLGNGSTNQTAWTSIPAAEVGIDSSNFAIKEVKFEAGLSIIGGEVYVRLINKTSGNVIYNSQLTHNNQTATWKSSTISLDQGNQTYQVQLRSSSGETATLHGARIKIYTQ